MNWAPGGKWNDWVYNVNARFVIEFDQVILSLTSGPASGSFFPVGTTSVTYKATDGSGNSSTCSFNVSVKDVSPPVLNNVPADATVECDAVPVGSAPVTASDNCGATLKYYTTPSIKTKLVHHWKADNNFNDAVGGANGTPSGTVSFKAGIIGPKSFSFDGTNAVVATGTAGSLAGTGNFSVSAWVKTTSNTSMVVIGQRNVGSFNGQYLLKVGGNHNNSVLRPGKVYFLVFGSGSPVVDLFSSATVNDGKWHQIIGERNGKDVRIYIDGVLDVNGSTVVNVSFNPVIATSIGKDIRDNNSFFNGMIDDVKVWSSPVCPNSYEVDRVWIAEDASGNRSAAIQHLSIQDTKAPALTGAAYAGTSGTNSCKSNALLSVPAFDAANAILGYTDNCSAIITTSLTNTVLSGSDCNWTVTYTFSVKDECNNILTGQSYSHTGSDQTAPAITSCTPTVFHCFNAATSPGNYSVPAINATDNCNSVTYSFAIAGATTRAGTGENASGVFNVGTSNILWTIKDECGNASICSTTVIINPALSATIPDVYAVNPGGNANTIYTGFGPSSLTLTAMPAGGTPGYIYSWSPGGTTSPTLVVSPSIPGTYTYTVTITDSKGCTTTASKQVIVVDIRCGNKNDKVLVCQVPPGNPGNAHTICISPNAVAAHLANGSYLGNCTNGNKAIASPFTLLEVINVKAQVRPNPTSGKFYINMPSYKSSKAEILIMGVNGSIVERRAVKAIGQIESFDLSRNSPGMYFIKIISEQGVENLKVVVQR